MDQQRHSVNLRKHGLVPTIQRVAVLDFLEKNRIHPTAEEIYIGVKDRFPSLSKATVYNVLDALKHAGAVRELTIARQAARYDINTSLHPHFMCRVCGKVYDIDLPLSFHEGDIIDGHQVESVQTYAYGVCADCRKKANSDNTVEGYA
jgi:Fur family peroxide stress response transcriptional regulator